MTSGFTTKSARLAPGISTPMIAKPAVIESDRACFCPRWPSSSWATSCAMSGSMVWGGVGAGPPRGVGAPSWDPLTVALPLSRLAEEIPERAEEPEPEAERAEEPDHAAQHPLDHESAKAVEHDPEEQIHLGWALACFAAISSSSSPRQGTFCRMMLAPSVVRGWPRCSGTSRIVGSGGSAPPQVRPGACTPPWRPPLGEAAWPPSLRAILWRTRRGGKAGKSARGGFSRRQILPH